MEESAEINRETAVGLFNFAASYLKAADHLVSEIEDGKLSLPFDAPVSLLTGHGFEILLKAFLRSMGVKNPEIKKIGHDLEELLRVAQDRGLKIEITKPEREHLMLLNKKYGKAPYLVRYLITGVTQMCDDRIVLKLAKRIQGDIGPSILGAVAWTNQRRRFL